MQESSFSAPESHRPYKRRNHRRIPLRFWASAVSLVIILVYLIFPSTNTPDRSDAPGTPSLPSDHSLLSAPIPFSQIQLPDNVVVDLIPQNEFSRPGTPLDTVSGVVIHYVGNPNTTAEQNRSYFGNLANTGETYASSHFIIGMDGTVICAVPLDEVAYCSNHRNIDTISIECCHPDTSGRFTQETYDALVELVSWLCQLYGLEQEDVIRHYDVTGKLCPKYYVDHPDAWDTFLRELSVS